MAAPIDRPTGAEGVNRVAFDFTGTAILVTGGTSGIGHAIASTFADAGARVTVTRRHPAAADYDTDLTRFTYPPLEGTQPASGDTLVASLDRPHRLLEQTGAQPPRGGG